jgi:hypothetical protein
MARLFYEEYTARSGEGQGHGVETVFAQKTGKRPTSVSEDSDFTAPGAG